MTAYAPPPTRDQGISEAGTPDLIESTAAATPGVLSVDRTHARWSGHRLEAELCLGVQGSLSIEIGHHLGQAVEERLRQDVPHLHRATILLVPAPAGP
ncbi:cation transporter dimerization domain-containing protein [Citricoccus alkalitolerans]|uniref:Cation transporter dimerization domain-containing protein n=1 Tax=Citricoccus alkalitolerans TaxID=246603 RepID=A0ABV8XZ04_9MICC